MRYTQFLVFEISNACNLAGLHSPACPASHPERWLNLQPRPAITDELILRCCEEAYAMGFRGLIAWHYYCEPMLEWDRLRPLMKSIRGANPHARFCLWTNGTLFPGDLAGLDLFETIYISDYTRGNYQRIRDVVSDVRIQPATLDGRAAGRRRLGLDRCLRPFNEFVIDHYGNGRLCCIDWMADVQLGNVWDGFRPVFERFCGVRDSVMRTPMAETAPDVCRQCASRQAVVGQLALDLVPEIKEYVQ